MNRTTMNAAPPLPLAGIRILDLGTRIAAPFAATLLADFGAEVIKVELPGSGDFMRGIGPFVGDYSLWWAVEGRGKKSITLDLRKQRGQALLKRLVRLSDVVVENFQPGTLEEWGLGYDVLSTINPGVILTRASVYGQSGPYRDRPGLDRNGIGFGGLLYITGYGDRPPVRPGIIVSDYLTGVFNAFAIMMALYHRDVHRGSGQCVDLALYESVFRILEHTAAAYDRLGVVREREGNRLRNSAPLDNWETKDGEFVCIVAAGDGLFPRLARAMGRDDLLQDERFATFQARVANGDAINTVVGEWVKRHTAAEVEKILVAENVPVTRAHSIADIFNDPHYAARSDIVTVDDPTIGPVKMQAVYPRLSATPGRIQRGAPKLGEHNDEIYRDLVGLSATEMDSLHSEGVI
ncbi:MAG TPA: CoA transferase [Candidatus Acidoferrales bacterium]|nr:CoA transferase [Candidatus Acidoferrales bacterium]